MFYCLTFICRCSTLHVSAYMAIFKCVWYTPKCKTGLHSKAYTLFIEQFLIPQLDKDDQEGCIHFRQDGEPPHYLGEVREYLSIRFSDRWISRAAPKAWLPRSPDFTPLDVFFRGFLKGRVFVPPLPSNAVELGTRIIAVAAEVTPEMLRSVWQEIHYRWDICRITSESHIEP
jgi:hypothetical protein